MKLKEAKPLKDLEIKAGYTYELPTTSPFYRNVVSPICDYIVDHLVPVWVSPDALTICGFLAACAAPLTLPTYPIVAALLWIIYGLFDNMDGKQARKTKKSSVRGEFLDHCADSFSSTILMYPITYGFISEFPQSHWCVFLGCQVPFLLGCWFYNCSGRVLLGNKIFLGVQITVDEVNLILVPGLLFAHVCFKNFAQLRLIGYGLMVASAAGCFHSGFGVLKQIASFHNPMQYKIATSALVYFLSIPLATLYSDPLICLPVFAWLCSCLIFPQCAKKASVTPTFIQTDPFCPALVAVVLMGCYLSNLSLAILLARVVSFAIGCSVIASQVLALPGPA